MKLTRKRAIEKVNRIYDDGFCIQECLESGVDYGIVLGLQMALDNIKKFHTAKGRIEMQTLRRLKKLEKGT